MFQCVMPASSQGAFNKKNLINGLEIMSIFKGLKVTGQ